MIGAGKAVSRLRGGSGIVGRELPNLKGRVGYKASKLPPLLPPPAAFYRALIASPPWPSCVPLPCHEAIFQIVMLSRFP